MAFLKSTITCNIYNEVILNFAFHVTVCMSSSKLLDHTVYTYKKPKENQIPRG